MGGVRRASRRLLLVRHAEAGRPDGVADFDRPLTGRGERDAEALGTWLVRDRSVPDVVLVSPAERASRTWQLASSAFDGQAPELLVEGRLYDADAGTVLQLVRESGGDAHTVAVVGHEPALSTLARTLADPETSDPEEVAGLGERFPTSGVVVLRTRQPWSDTRPGGLVLSRVVVPRP